MRHRLSVAGWLALLLLAGTANAHAMPSLTQGGQLPDGREAAHGLTQLAQAQAPTPPTQTPAPAPAAAPAPVAAPAQPADAEPIGNVATLTGSATVTRNNAATPLKLKDDIFQNDVLQTSANSTLGITFNDATTFNLRANAKITIDSYVYEDGGQQNNALFNVAKGTAAFVAAAVAKTGNMKISTPTATLGIRGTTGLVEVPEGATATSDNIGIKLYPDPDGHVGRIEVADRSGASLGVLTRGASGFAIRPGTGGARFAAVPLTISPQQMARDQGFVRAVHSAQTVGRQVVSEQRDFRRANPDFRRANPAAPYPNRGQPAQPSQQRQNGLPGQNRNAPQQPGQPNRPGQPQQPGTPGRQGSQQQPGTQQPGAAQHSLPGQPGGAALPRAPGAQPPAGQQPAGQQPARQEPARQGSATQPSGVQPGSPRVPAGTQPPGGARQPGAPQQNGALPPAVRPQGQPQPSGIQQATPGAPRPFVQRPAAPRPGVQQRRPPAPKPAKPPPKKRT